MLVVIVKFGSLLIAYISKETHFLNKQDESIRTVQRAKVELERGCKKTKQNVCVIPHLQHSYISPCNASSIHAIVQAALLSNIILPTLGAYLCDIRIHNKSVR